MAIARQHAVAGAEIFFDGFRLGGRFDDDEFQAGQFLYVRTRDFRMVDSVASSGQAHLASSMTFEPAAELQFEKNQLDRTCGCFGEANDLVDGYR